jgi:hypothetical protein
MSDHLSESDIQKRRFGRLVLTVAGVLVVISTIAVSLSMIPEKGQRRLAAAAKCNPARSMQSLELEAQAMAKLRHISIDDAEHAVEDAACPRFVTR